MRIFRDIFSRLQESLFIILAIMLGVISVSSVYHYSESLKEAIHAESLQRMGADLAVESSRMIEEQDLRRLL